MAAFIYLGFVAAGEEIEQPFGYDEACCLDLSNATYTDFVLSHRTTLTSTSSVKKLCTQTWSASGAPLVQMHSSEHISHHGTPKEDILDHYLPLLTSLLNYNTRYLIFLVEPISNPCSLLTNSNNRFERFIRQRTVDPPCRPSKIRCPLPVHFPENRRPVTTRFHSLGNV